jgi:hypothetical protein
VAFIGYIVCGMLYLAFSFFKDREFKATGLVLLWAAALYWLVFR